MLRGQILTPRAAQLCMVLAVSVGVSGCAVFGAGRDVGVPPLEIPEAPPRIVADFPAEAAPVEDPRPEASVPLVEVPSVDPDPSTDVRTAPGPEPDPTPPVDPASDVEPDEPPVPLQLAPAPEQTVDVEMVRRRLRGTARVLEEIDRTGLNAAGRSQHDTARRFLNQASAALAAGNLTFAHYLNEKAETLARDLDTR